MKKSMILCALLLVVPLWAAAQEAIHFVAGTPAQPGLSQKTIDALRLKTEQILARNNAGAAPAHGAFVLQPELRLGEVKKTEGLLREVTLVGGEFSLTARNRYDGSIYGTAVIEVQGDAAGSREEALSSLISGIKVTDPAFVRFIRTTRKRIAEHYEQNCPAILKQAQALVAAGKGEEASDYLSAVPATAPCYDEVIALLERLYKDKPVDAPRLPDAAPTDPAPEAQPVPAEPVEEATPDPAAPQPEADPQTEYKVAVSCDDLTFELVACEGNETAEAIRIYVRFTNTGATNDGATIRMTSAIAPNGATFTNFSQVEVKGCTSWTYGNKMPKGVKIGKVFEIKRVRSAFDALSYVEMMVDDCKVIIRDLPVKWK